MLPEIPLPVVFVLLAVVPILAGLALRVTSTDYKQEVHLGGFKAPLQPSPGPEYAKRYTSYEELSSAVMEVCEGKMMDEILDDIRWPPYE